MNEDTSLIARLREVENFLRAIDSPRRCATVTEAIQLLDAGGTADDTPGELIRKAEQRLTSARANLAKQYEEHATAADRLRAGAGEERIGALRCLAEDIRLSRAQVEAMKVMRDACAKVIETMADTRLSGHVAEAMLDAAKSIRASGGT